MKKFGIFVALVAGFLFTTSTASAQVFGRGSCSSGGSCNSGGRVFHHGGGLFHHHQSAPSCGGQVVYSTPTYYSAPTYTCGGGQVYYSTPTCNGTVYGTPVYGQPITLPAPSSTYVLPTVGGTTGGSVVPPTVIVPKQPFTLPAPSSKQQPR